MTIWAANLRQALLEAIDSDKERRGYESGFAAGLKEVLAAIERREHIEVRYGKNE